MVTVHIDDELAAVIGETEEPVERAAREMIVLELYRRGTISSGKAAQLLGMSRLDFIQFSGRLGILYIDMTPDEWAAEVRTIDEITAS